MGIRGGLPDGTRDSYQPALLTCFFMYSLSFSRNTHSERFHRTLAERMTTYIAKEKCWVDMLPTIIVSTNYRV